LTFRVVRGVCWILAWLLALGCAVWAFGALYFDFPVMNDAAAWTFALALRTPILASSEDSARSGCRQRIAIVPFSPMALGM
jgi:hypothetical protein